MTDLHELEPFKGCTAKQLRRIDNGSTPLHFAAGRTITQDAGSGRQVIVVCRGSVLIERDGQSLGPAGAGAVVAMVKSLGEALDPGVSVHALTDCEVLAFTRGEFFALEADMPAVARRLRAEAAALVRQLPTTPVAPADAELAALPQRA